MCEKQLYQLCVYVIISCLWVDQNWAMEGCDGAAKVTAVELANQARVFTKIVPISTAKLTLWQRRRAASGTADGAMEGISTGSCAFIASYDFSPIQRPRRSIDLRASTDLDVMTYLVDSTVWEQIFDDSISGEDEAAAIATAAHTTAFMRSPVVVPKSECRAAKSEQIVYAPAPRRPVELRTGLEFGDDDENLFSVPTMVVWRDKSLID